jgi:HAD superfamily hydrolase (TIGR01549 family)
MANLALLPDAIEILDLVRAHSPLGLVTNGDSAEQREKLRRCALMDYFDPLVISDDLGISKPEPAIFQQALDALGVSAHRTVYIGNSFANDVEGGAGVGIDTIWLNERGDGPPANAKYLPTATISALRELPPLLGLRRD